MGLCCIYLRILFMKFLTSNYKYFLRSNVGNSSTLQDLDSTHVQSVAKHNGEHKPQNLGFIFTK
jgi:hypothetical protein